MNCCYINKEDIKISRHAIEKYCFEMNKKRVCVIDPEKEIRLLFNNAKEEKLNPGLLLRIMNNNFEETIFFKNRKWRFVVCNNIMVTIEIDAFRDKSIGYIKKKNIYK